MQRLLIRQFVPLKILPLTHWSSTLAIVSDIPREVLRKEFPGYFGSFNSSELAAATILDFDGLNATHRASGRRSLPRNAEANFGDPT
jgi:hypothetical protein